MGAEHINIYQIHYRDNDHLRSVFATVGSANVSIHDDDNDGRPDTAYDLVAHQEIPLPQWAGKYFAEAQAYFVGVNKQLDNLKTDQFKCEKEAPYGMKICKATLLESSAVTFYMVVENDHQRILRSFSIPGNGIIKVDVGLYED